MSSGSKSVISPYEQQHQQNNSSFESMDNMLLAAMHGILVYLDKHHIIIDISKTVKPCFGFEQAELVGLSLLLLIEDSERDSFLKFLNSSSQSNDIYYVRMAMNNTNEYRQVKVHRKKYLNPDIHSTIPQQDCSIRTILLMILEDSSYIDITLFDIHKQEFYTKMNITGEIVFQDHRGALITGYLPNEILSKSIFDFVHYDDRLVKLHAIWKCVTTGSSNLQWRFNACDGSLVFLYTEHKLISDHLDHYTIVSRNEVLNSMQKSQFDDLQNASKHQCAADINGNNSSFKRSDSNLLSVSNNTYCICDPSLNMYFTTDQLQTLHVQGNIFTKLTRPLTIQDYIHILMYNDHNMDSEVATMINNIQSLTACYRRLNEKTKSQISTSAITTDEKAQFESSSPLVDTSLHSKHESDSIVRGILSSSIKDDHQKQTGDSCSALVRLLNANGPDTQSTLSTSLSTTSKFQSNQSKPNPNQLNLETRRQQYTDFMKKYRAAKAQFESQLELIRKQEATNLSQPNSVMHRNTILNKLSQLENLKNKHLARFNIRHRQTLTPTIPLNDQEQNDILNSSSISSSSPKSIGSLAVDNSTTTYNSSPLFSLLSSPSCPHQQNSSQESDHGQTSSYLNSNSLFDKYLAPSPSSSAYTPINNSSSTSFQSHQDISFQEPTNYLIASPSFTYNQHNTSYHS